MSYSAGAVRWKEKREEREAAPQDQRALRESGMVPDGRALRAMIVPLFFEQLLQMVVGIADTVMVSYAGEEAVSGVSLDTMFYTIFLYLFTAIATGGAVVLSQYLGAGDRERAERAAGQVFRIAALFSLLCMALILVSGRTILQLLYGSADPAVLRACRTYLWIVTLSFPGNAIGVLLLHAGAAGVAWPTTISWSVAALLMTALCGVPRDLPVRLRARAVLRRDPQMRRRILHVAIPSGIESGLFQASKVFLGTFIAGYGTSQIAANGIAQSIWSLVALASTAMSPVYLTVIGQCMGAGALDAAREQMRRLTRLTLILTTLWNVLIIALLPLILRFYQASEETLHLVVVMVVLHGVFAALVQPFSLPLSFQW